MRVNRAIQLLEDGQPIYYTGGHGVVELTFEAGVQAATTWADYINIGMEHGPYDPSGLAAFMRGLASVGPTRSGHPTPTVLVELPLTATSREAVLYNAWQIKQLLTTGIHGFMLCHCESADAVQAVVECMRYSFRDGKDEGIGAGRRGSGGQADAARIWGIDANAYVECADPWPLNPNGELLLGLKIENSRALENAESVASVPGVAFAEWGPADMAFSMGHRHVPTAPFPTELQSAYDRVFAACKDAGIAFLEGADDTDIEGKIDAGIRVFPSSEAAAKKGRQYTKRTLPV